MHGTTVKIQGVYYTTNLPPTIKFYSWYKSVIRPVVRDFDFFYISRSLVVPPVLHMNEYE